MQQPGAPQAPEQQMQQDQVIQVQDLLGQMRDRLLRLQAQLPEMQQAPIAHLLKELGQVQGNASQMTASEIQERLGQLQEQMRQVESGLPKGSLPPEAQAELARMQQQMAQVMAQVMTQMVVQVQQQAAVLLSEEQKDEDEIDLSDLNLGAEDLSDLFDVEEVEDQYTAALKEGLEEIDMPDLLEECKKVASQLREGNSLVSRVIREQSQKEVK
ncbi:MAG: hypothetical protein FJ026_11950 [Chloroflexi bacterium]|nr:hypothetical protein [Chloroflexota bacterium]